MKTFNILLSITLGSLLLSSCNDEFMDKFPKDRFTNETFWKSDGDFRSYSLGLYNFQQYLGAQIGNSDDVARARLAQDPRIFNRRIVPESGGVWNWSYIRRVNIMIEQARKATTLSDEEKNHWEGVGRFFRAREYYKKICSFGEVPWIGKELGTASEELYKPKDTRTLVMDSVMADLNFAVANIRKKDGKNQINRDMALFVKSCICLSEGSYRKYHTYLNLNDAEKWFRESMDASEQLMQGDYSLTPYYRDLYSSLDLSSNKECLYFNEFDGVNLTSGIQFNLSIVEGAYGATKDAIESYLCTDGLPYGVSPLHPKVINGQPEFIEEEYVDRDPRLAMTWVVPFRDNNPTQLPAMDEAYTQKVPPFMPAFPGEDFLCSHTGYHPYKWWNAEDENIDWQLGTTDFPVYTYNRILLNYAEAAAELGLCTNEVLNKSINLLRDRVGMPHLTVELAESINDPRHTKYAPEISSLLWEIRRERRVELMMDNTRLDDILRWKKASWFSKPFLGCYLDLNNRPKEALKPDGTPKTNVVLGDRDGNVIQSSVGYVLPYQNIKQPVWSDDDLKVYYDPINKQDLTLNPNLTQSPGWENE